MIKNVHNLTCIVYGDIRHSEPALRLAPVRGEQGPNQIIRRQERRWNIQTGRVDDTGAEVSDVLAVADGHGIVVEFGGHCHEGDTDVSAGWCLD